MQRSLTVLSLFYRAQGRFSRRRLLRRTESGQSNVWKAPRRGLSTAGLSEAQWNFKSAPGPMVGGGMTEHIAAAEDFLMGVVTGQVMNRPRGPLAMM